MNKILLKLLIVIVIFVSSSIQVVAHQNELNEFRSPDVQILSASLSYNFFVDIFIPSENYFNNKIAEMSSLINEKLGGIRYLYQMISYFFEFIQTVPDYDYNLNLQAGVITPNQSNINVDLFYYSNSFVSLFRLSVSGFICICTAIICYKRAVKMLKE